MYHFVSFAQVGCFWVFRAMLNFPPQPKWRNYIWSTFYQTEIPNQNFRKFENGFCLLNYTDVGYFCFIFSGEVAVDFNVQLVIAEDFNNDLLNRSSNRFLAMEEKIGTAVRTAFIFLKGYLLYARSLHY